MNEDSKLIEMVTLRSFSTSDLVDWLKQIATGMDFLEMNKIIHRDLAARNILLCEDFVVKISDFGHARDVDTYGNNEYYKKSKREFAFRWMAPETLAKISKFSSASDVWSFGMISWKLFAIDFLAHHIHF